MGEVVGLDVGGATELADLLERLERSVVAERSAVDAALRRGELDRSAVAIAGELADELGALARYVRAVVDETVMTDRLGSSASGTRWFETMRADWREAERAVWLGLGDGVGADGADAGILSLADSIVPLDRPTWMRTAIPPDCRSFGPDAYYTGGGAIRGPDGRSYPIVVPHVQRGDEHFTIDADIPAGVPTAASLDGRDAGWTVVSYRTGVEQIHAEISGWMQAAMAAAFATGLPAPGSVDDAHLAAIELRLGGRPRFVGSAAPTASGRVDATTGQEIRPHTGPVVDGRIGGRTADGRPRTKPLPTPPASPSTIAHANRHANAATLVVDGLHGIQLALSVDDANHRAYEVILEEHDDGRRRARVQTFHLEPRADGVLLAGWHLFVDDHGDLRQSPVKYQTAPTGDTDDPDDSDRADVVAVNGLDPDYGPKVPNPAFEP